MDSDSAPTLINIVRRCGGAESIARATNNKVGAAAVYKWLKNGIPDRHWPVVKRLSGATADDLLAANEAVRTVEVAS